MIWQVRLIVALLVTVTVTVAHHTVRAQERVGSNYTIYGMGAENCSTLVQNLTHQNKTVSESWRGTIGAWIGGFVTGFDAHAGLSRMLISGAADGRDTAALPSAVLDAVSRPLRKTQVEGLVTWVQSYCAEHPLDTVARATRNLVIELATKR
jgi:hypothetical protein